MRLVTYNIRALKQSRAAVVAVLRAAAPDVLVVQEPPKWWFGRTRLRRLARDCGLRVEVPGGLWGARTVALLVREAGAEPDAAASGRADGTRSPVVRSAAVRSAALRLPLQLRHRVSRFPSLRGAAVADVAGVVVVGLHLSLDPAERADHLARVVALADRAAGGDWTRVVAAGDLNELPGGPAWQTLEERGLTDRGAGDPRPTFSTSAPRYRLDVVLAGSGLTGDAARVDHPRAAAASDHYPVVAVLRPGAAADVPAAGTATAQEGARPYVP